MKQNINVKFFSSLAKAGFAWGLTGSAASAFNTATPAGLTASQTLGYGSANNSSNYMYSAVVSASSTSPTTSDQDGAAGLTASKADLLQQYSKSNKEVDDLSRETDTPRGGTNYTSSAVTASVVTNSMV